MALSLSNGNANTTSRLSQCVRPCFAAGNVLFEDANTAKLAVAGIGKPLPPAEAPDATGSHLDPTDPGNMHLLWHRGGEFEKSGTSIPLMFR